MKIRNGLILFHIGILLVTILCIHNIQASSYKAEDVADLNKRVQIAREDLQECSKLDSKQRQEIEDRVGCNIYLVSDTNYMEHLYKSYTNGDVVFDYLVGQELYGKIVFERSNQSLHKMKRHVTIGVFVFILVVSILVDGLVLTLYLWILRPFRQLQRFATSVAVGNLEMPVEMQKHNYFGAFTESFDIMRTELKQAREGEAKANRSKKELVASLSHDIKSPIATIKALCEILEIKLTEEEQVKKVHIIQQKADLIDQLISNMFHATLSELEALKINPKEEPSTVITEMLQSMDLYQKIRIESTIPECLICCDLLRLTQVLDNIINNSYKYAGTDLHVRAWDTTDQLCIEIRDEGKELEDLDFALVCEKFYRGSNSEGKNGSGLGLYLAKLFMEGMGGSLSCEKKHGFAVTLSLQKAGKQVKSQSQLRNR